MKLNREEGLGITLLTPTLRLPSALFYLEKFSSNLRGVLGYIKYSKDKKELSRFLNNSQMILRKNKLVIIIILVEKQL